MNRWTWVQLLLVAVFAAIIGDGFGSMFSESEIGRAVLIAAVVPVLIAAGVRLGGVRSVGLAAGMSLLGLVVAAALVVFDEAGAGLPTAETVRSVADGVINGWDRMVSTTLPAPATDDLVFVAFLVVWIAAAAAAEVVLRTRAPLAPSLPLLAGLVATAVLTSGTAFQGRGVLAVQLGLLATLTLVRTRNTRRLGRSRWDPRRVPTHGDASDRGDLPMPARRRQWILALPVLAVVLLLAPLGADRLPGASARPYDPREGRVPPVIDRDLVSPLATVVAQLRQSPPATLFRVTASEPQNWRTVTLDRYDGASWSSGTQFVLAGRELPQPVGQGASRELLQRFSIEALKGPWLPAAARPTATSVDEVAFDESSGSLAVADGGSLLPATYSVTSAVPEYRADQLASARVATAEELPGVDTALEVADGFPAEVAALADRLTASATTDYTRLRALQSYLRDSGEYVLATNGLPGHTYAHVRAFLVGTTDPEADTGASADDAPLPGTSEQFATAFAAMARYLGYPTRLAVGYRPGSLDEGVFSVTSADAHVWPEVALEGVGWVPFDPTPVGADEVTADENLETAQSEADQTPPPDEREQPDDPEADTEREVESVSSERRWLPLIGAGLVAVLLVALVGVVGVAVFKRHRRHRRSNGSSRQRVVGAWVEVTDRLRDAGVSVTSRMTPMEVAAASDRAGWPDAVPSISELGRLSNRAQYSAKEVPAPFADRAWDAVGRVTQALDAEASAPVRVRRAISSRSLRRMR